MDGIAEYIRDLIWEGNQGRILEEYSTFYYLDDENFWRKKTIHFKWNYM